MPSSGRMALGVLLFPHWVRRESGREMKPCSTQRA